MEFKIFSDFSELRYGLSERSDGPMRLMDNGKPSIDAEKNRLRYFKKVGVGGRIFSPTLDHGTRVVIVTENNSGRHVKADGLVTSVRNLILTVTVADCFPLYFSDPLKKVVGIAHAGWRGVVGNIVKNVVTTMCDGFQSNPGDILLGIGPGVGQCHFEIKEKTVKEFAAYPQFVKNLQGSLYVDLLGIIKLQLGEVGISETEDFNVCTFCSRDKYFSRRRDGAETGAMIAYIGLK